MKKVVIFDFDGVILDSFPDQYKWFQHISHKLGRTFFHSYEEFRNDYTEPVYPNMYELLALDWEKNKNLIWQEYNGYKRNSRINLVPGIAGELEKVRGLGLEMAIASSNTNEIVLKHLDSNNLSQYFRTIVTKDDLIEPGRKEPRLKPDPYCLYVALKQLKANPEDALYIGDQTTDIIAARRVKEKLGHEMKVLAVTYGYANKSRLVTYHPDFIADKPEGIVPEIRKAFSL